jgi:DNA-binding transcriptional MocR family regulator
MAKEPVLHRKVTARVVDLIEGGTLAAGDQAPSIRRLSRELGVSISTVVKAYGELERRGLVESRPQSGFYVRAIPLAEPEPAKLDLHPTRVSLSNLTQMVYDTAYDPEVVPLGATVPSTEILPVRQLGAVVGRIMRDQGAEAASYIFPPGSLALRKQLALRTVTWPRPLRPDDVLVTNGAMEAVNLCLRAVTKPGDLVAVDSPTYFVILQSLVILGLLAVVGPRHPDDGIDLAALEKVLAHNDVAACLFTTNFNNPSGHLVPDRRKQDLATLLARRKVPLIEDDVYGDLSFAKKRPLTVKAFDRLGNVLLCSSFSKTLGPGFRVGWVAAGRFHDRVTSLKFTSTIAAPSLQQLVLAEVLASGAYDRHLVRMRRTIEQTVARSLPVITRHFPAGTKVSRPLGGMALWVALPPGTDAVRLCDRALRAGIGMTPGILFSPRKTYANCLRLNCANAWSDAIEQALARLGKLARS